MQSDFLNIRWGKGFFPQKIRSRHMKWFQKGPTKKRVFSMLQAFQTPYNHLRYRYPETWKRPSSFVTCHLSRHEIVTSNNPTNTRIGVCQACYNAGKQRSLSYWFAIEIVAWLQYLASWFERMVVKQPTFCCALGLVLGKKM